MPAEGALSPNLAELFMLKEHIQIVRMKLASERRADTDATGE